MHLRLGGPPCMPAEQRQLEDICRDAKVRGFQRVRAQDDIEIICKQAIRTAAWSSAPRLCGWRSRMVPGSICTEKLGWACWKDVARNDNSASLGLPKGYKRSHAGICDSISRSCLLRSKESVVLSCRQRIVLTEKAWRTPRPRFHILKHPFSCLRGAYT